MSARAAPTADELRALYDEFEREIRKLDGDELPRHIWELVTAHLAAAGAYMQRVMRGDALAALRCQVALEYALELVREDARRRG